MREGKCALLIVDMQRYYLDPNSPFHAFSTWQAPGALDYISNRVDLTVLPSLSLLIPFFREKSWPVCYAKLCGLKEDRSDLHRFFRGAHEEALKMGIADLYPLESDPMADVLHSIRPVEGDPVFRKTGFSAFSSTDIAERLRHMGVTSLAMAGLATSQCVETTARDASDSGFSIIHLEDAQADYSQIRHDASLFASSMVCGGWVIDSAGFMATCGELMEEIRKIEFT
jgi:nicotinamidase-related amidase